MGAVARLSVIPASNYDLYCEPISHVQPHRIQIGDHSFLGDGAAEMPLFHSLVPSPERNDMKAD
jgi:hypothetical protein